MRAEHTVAGDTVMDARLQITRCASCETIHNALPIKSVERMFYELATLFLLSKVEEWLSLHNSLNVGYFHVHVEQASWAK